MCKLRVGGFHFTALDVVEDNDTDIRAVICTLCSALTFISTYVCDLSCFIYSLNYIYWYRFAQYATASPLLRPVMV